MTCSPNGGAQFQVNKYGCTGTQLSEINTYILSICREVKGSREKVITDKDLELLLDRSDLIGKYIYQCLFYSFECLSRNKLQM